MLGVRSFFKTILIVILVFIAFSVIGGIYRFFVPDQSSFHAANIGVIEVEGVITTSMPVMEQLAKLQENKNLKALVVRIESPGGAVGASQEIYMELKKLRDKMPVVVSMGDVAASGGLYVSLGGAKVFALPGTLTGSMGVLLQLTSFHRLMEKAYLDPVTIRSGDLKDAGNPTKALSPEAKKYFESLIGITFQSFKKTVQEERKLTDEAVQVLSDGRVVDGATAVTLKLVDEIGTFNDAVNAAKEMAKIDGEPKLAFLSREPESFIQKLVHEVSLPLRKYMNQSFKGLEFRWDPGAASAL